MGVPALFRWLSQKYPKIVSPVQEELPKEMEDGTKIPIDTRGPNPNGEEMDNLYLDMNGIVHPCSHPEDRPAPANEEEMMMEVFKYTDRVVNMVRPRKLLMIAVGMLEQSAVETFVTLSCMTVAPGASSCYPKRGWCCPKGEDESTTIASFRSAQEAKEKDDEKAEFAKLLRQQNGGVLPDHAIEEMNKKTWDSNAITPGTPFMDTLAASLRYWCAYKINTDPMWLELKVIISDATVPGEGEHKIMEFIRSQRSSQEHDPNTRHVIYGLDADLIMLGLATHEPHFRVLREDVFAQDSKPRTCRICGQTGHYADQCRGEVKKKQGEFDEKTKVPELKPFIWLHVSILREYLAVEMEVPHREGVAFSRNLERALDDWVFMCFFVGNDFLPHLPSLDIREQGIDTLLTIWRENILDMGDYVTKDGVVDLDKAQLILAGLAKQENDIFKKRREIEERKEAGQAAKRRRTEDNRQRYQRNVANGNLSFDTPGLNLVTLESQRDQTRTNDVGNLNPSSINITHEMVVNGGSARNATQANKSAAAILKEKLMAGKTSTGNSTNGADIVQADNAGSETSDGVNKRKRENGAEDDLGTPGRHSPVVAPKSAPANTIPQADPDAPAPDDIKLWEDGYADRYYQQKFHVAADDHGFRHKVARAYVEGLAWVLLYYFQGCPSWTWYYPYHYAPFAADFVDMRDMKVNFVKGEPFRPYEQLMGVMPATSNHTIPPVFRPLMSDEDSDILEFYPETFPLDLNGKKFAWQGVALLPFIDEKRLLKAMATKYPLLSEDEIRRNERGHDALIFGDKHPLYEKVATAFYSKKQGAPKIKITPQESKGLAGKIEKNDEYLPSSSLNCPLPGGRMPDLDEDHSISVHFEFPHSNNLHKSMLLRGVKFAPKALDSSDIGQARSQRDRGGRPYDNESFRGGRNGSGRGGRGRGGHNGYSQHGNGHHNQHGNGHNNLGPPANFVNPIASHLNPAFFANGVPPPSSNGWLPPPPGAPGYGAPGGYQPLPPPQWGGPTAPQHSQGRGGHSHGPRGNGSNRRW